MKVKQVLLAMTCCIPFIANASMVINNNTDHVSTGHIGKIKCTSTIGDKGVIKPHDQIVVPKLAMRMYCRHNCTADIYMSDNCSGEAIATLSVDEKSGVQSVQNHDSAHYNVVASGKELTINQVSVKKWYQKLFS